MTEQERLAAALEYQQAQQPARMNPNLAAQGARGRENMMPPTSVMDERYPAFKRNQEDAEKLMLGLDIVGSAIPLAGPAVKGAKILGQAAAPQIAQALENYTFKTGMALPMVERQAGRTFAAPQDEALRLAQERAALPVERGGLGLPPNNTAEQRAAAMGFDTPSYHGSGEELRVIDNEKVKRNAYGKGLHSASDPQLANIFATHSVEGQNLTPLKLRLGNQATKQDYKDAMHQVWEEGQHDANKIRQILIDKGFDTVTYNHGDFYYPQGDKLVASVKNQDLSYASLIPENVRSRFAAFDPFRRNAAIAAAMGVAAPDLLAKEKKK